MTRLHGNEWHPRRASPHVNAVQEGLSTGTDDRRWPHSLYASGDEPDPRFTLANERTFLAWIRTSIALIALAGAALAFKLPMPRGFQLTGIAILAALGVGCAGWAWRSWVMTESALRLRQPLPGLGWGALIWVGVALAVAVFAIGVALG